MEDISHGKLMFIWVMCAILLASLYCYKQASVAFKYFWAHAPPS